MHMHMQIKSLDEYQKTYQYSVENPEAFWHEIAQNFSWQTPYEKVLAWNFDEPDVKWFINGRLNITENCIDRHLPERAEQIAYIFEPNEPDQPNQKTQHISYQTLHDEVCRLANLLKYLEIGVGDRVCIYMPMIKEALYAMLACARIGAIHSVVFAGFSAQALQERINDSQCKIILTADGAYRGAKKINIQETVDLALENCPSIEKVLIYQHIDQNIKTQEIQKKEIQEADSLGSKKIDWQTAIEKQSAICPPTYVDSEHPLFILYTSGSTGKPKGVVHSCGGYMVYTCYSFLNVFQYNNKKNNKNNLNNQNNDSAQIYFCTADVGWITGHSYTLYGPLLAGATSVIFEGMPNYPDAGRFWQIIDKHQVNIFYTAPTAIRALQGAGLEFVKPYQLNSLEVLGSVGEPLNEEAWHWYDQNIGKGRCPIVDTWWQTETGGILISPLAGLTQKQPAFATLPLPGIQPVIVDEQGVILANEGEGRGHLCIRFPWPSMLRTTYGDHARCRQTYFSTYPGLYFTGDGCYRDINGNYKITGRVDDVINVSGHRIGTAEVENAINTHPAVVESAVVGFNHPIKGQAIYAYCMIKGDMNIDVNMDEQKNIKTLNQEINDCIVKMIGAIARADKIQIVAALPKTRSGKIMRRILRKIAEGAGEGEGEGAVNVENLGDTSTLLDPAVVEDIIKGRI